MSSLIQLRSSDPEGILGAPAESDFRADTYTAGEDMNPGIIALRDATTKRLRAPATAADVAKCECAVLYDPLHVPASTSVLYDTYDAVPGMRRGFLWAKNEEAMTIHDPVYVRHTAKGANTVLGAIRDDDDRNAATAAVVTVVDNDDGAYSVTVSEEDNAEGSVTFSFTASTSTIDDIVTGLTAAVDAHPRFAATADLGANTVTIVSATATLAVRVDGLASPENATPNMTATDGSANPTCTLHPDLRVDRDASSANLCRLAVNFN
jgi:hypothetical protein